MDLLDNLALGLSTAATMQNLLYCFVGVFLGTFIGVRTPQQPHITSTVDCCAQLAPMTPKSS